MSNIKDPQRFAELEYTLEEYFSNKVSRVMTDVQKDLHDKQFNEMEAYRNSAAGRLASYNYDKTGDTTMFVLKHLGEWNSKTVEDYVSMCQQKLQNDEGFQKDLLTMAAEWRNAVVAQIGRDRYDQLSQQLGGDLAYAYVATRMDDMMMQKLVNDGMPRDTADYIIRKAAQGSLWGLEQELSKSPLAREIEEKGEAAFNPGKGAKFAGMLGGSVLDAASLGVTSWASLATFVGGDMLVSSFFSDNPASEQKEMTMEAAISKGVFGSDTNVFTGFRQQTASLLGTDNQYLNTLNSKLNNKITAPSKPFMKTNIYNTSKPAWQPTTLPGKPADRTTEKYEDVPLVVAPGQEDAYLASKTQQPSQTQVEEKTTEMREEGDQSGYGVQSVSQSETTETVSASQTTEEESQQQTSGNRNGWDQLLQATGLDGISDVGKNLPYVVSMLPDVLVGMFTGKTQSLNMKNTLMPLAAIFAGMFVKNPILKLALIGFGGANLLNKAGKESISWQQGQSQQIQNVRPQYRQYADEALNPRITNPVLQGTTLIANIDKVPCNIQLTQTVVDANQSGALPLNTLANAVLARYDAMQARAQQQYGQVEQQSQSQTETIHRTR